MRPKILAGTHTSATSSAEVNSNSVVAAAAHWKDSQAAPTLL